MTKPDHDVIVVGGGQAGLAVAYYLRRANADFVILDAEEAPGGAWQHTWDSLRLFSPAGYSSLPGWQMTASKSHGFPTRNEVIDYLTHYEMRYEIPIRRPCKVTAVERSGKYLAVRLATGETLTTRAVISATGTWSKPFIPDYPGSQDFKGEILHSAFYRGPERFKDRHVIVVGGGNSGAQILAEISEVANAVWVTPTPPAFLPDDVDGRVLFERATARIKGETDTAGEQGLGSIVMVPPVKDARERGVLNAVRPFEQFVADGVVWKDGTKGVVDAVIWCTGFRPATDHLRPLGIVDETGQVALDDQQAIAEPRLWMAGYGNWSGAASATLIGAGRTARDMVPRILSALAIPSKYGG